PGRRVRRARRYARPPAARARRWRRDGPRDGGATARGGSGAPAGRRGARRSAAEDRWPAPRLHRDARLDGARRDRRSALRARAAPGPRAHRAGGRRPFSLEPWARRCRRRAARRRPGARLRRAALPRGRHRRPGRASHRSLSPALTGARALRRARPDGHAVRVAGKPRAAALARRRADGGADPRRVRRQPRDPLRRDAGPRPRARAVPRAHRGTAAAPLRAAARDAARDADRTPPTGHAPGSRHAGAARRGPARPGRGRAPGRGRGARRARARGDGVSAQLAADVTFLAARYQALRDAVGRVVVGQEAAIRLGFATLLCSGHSLLEGVPGVAKTLLVQSLAASVDVRFGRVQFTPDLMPSDIVGTAVLDPRERDTHFRPGPLFTDLLLADEINRASAK